MSPVTRPAFALALATALAGTAPLPAAADDPEEPVVQHCFATSLTPEEVEAGAYTEIECYEDLADRPAQRDTTIDYAIVYDISNGTGSDLTLSGPSCTGAKFNFAPGHAWNDIISATTLVACGDAKHYQGNSYSGTYELKSGSGYHTFTGGMNNTTSSIEYAP